MSPSQGRLLVPVGNPRAVDRLVDTAVDLARERSLSVVAFHVVTVPAQLPLDVGEEVVSDEATELLERAGDRLSAAGVDAETKLRYARDVAPAIVGSVDAFDGDALLMGWHGRPRRRDIVLGSFLDHVLGNAPCDVYVKRVRSASQSPSSVLVPVAGGPHDELAAELAGTVAAQHDATVSLLYVDAPDEETDDPTDLFEKRRAVIPEAVAVEERVTESDHVAGAITDETADHDLTVLGATRDPFLGRKLVGSVAQGVGRTATSSVIVTRRYLDREQP